MPCDAKAWTVKNGYKTFRKPPGPAESFFAVTT